MTTESSQYYEDVSEAEFKAYKKAYGYGCGPTPMIDSTHIMYADGKPVGLIRFDDRQCTKNPQYRLAISRDKSFVLSVRNTIST
jgi:hypothetical protein